MFPLLQLLSEGSTTTSPGPKSTRAGWVGLGCADPMADGGGWPLEAVRVFVEDAAAAGDAAVGLVPGRLASTVTRMPASGIAIPTTHHAHFGW